MAGCVNLVTIGSLGPTSIGQSAYYGLYTIGLTVRFLQLLFRLYDLPVFGLVLYLLNHRTSTHANTIQRCLADAPAAIRQFIIGSLLAGGMSMVVLIPTALGMLLTGKVMSL